MGTCRREPPNVAMNITGLTALTLWPEWLPCFTVLDKRTENRTWAPPDRLIGEDLVLHAGKSVGGGSFKKGADWLSETAEAAGWWVSLDRRPKPPSFHWSLVGVLDQQRMPLPLGAAVCVARLVGADQRQETLWDMEDLWHWRLEDIRVLPEPVPMRGHQRLFRVKL